MQCLASSEPTPQPAGSAKARCARGPDDGDAQDVFAAVLAALPLPGGPIPTPAETDPVQADSIRLPAPTGVADPAGPFVPTGAGPGTDGPAKASPASAGQGVAASGGVVLPPEAAPEPAGGDPPEVARVAVAGMAVAGPVPDPLSAGALPEAGRPAGLATEGAVADVLADAPSEAGDTTAGDGGGIDVARTFSDGHADGDGDPGANGEGAPRDRGEGDEAALAAPTAGDHRVFRLHADRDRPGTIPVSGLRDDPGPRAGAGIPETVVRSAGGPIEVTLAPPELGRVHMALRDQDGALSLSLSADRPETLDLMRRHADLLEKDLRMLGYGSVAFHFGQGGSGARAAAPPPLPSDADRPGATDPAPVRPAPGLGVGAGASIDIRL